MITVESFFNQVTGPKQILASMKEMLAAVNPQFAVEEQKYKEAAKILLESVENVLPSAEEYLAALEERYGYELLYIGWQGFQYNRDTLVTFVDRIEIGEKILPEGYVKMPRKNASYQQSIRIFYKFIGEIVSEPVREFAPGCPLPAGTSLSGEFNM